MSKSLLISPALCLVMLTATSGALGQEAEPADDEPAAPVESEEATPEKPKTMSGMSILGNEEAPKSLVIIPWKSSELGTDISLTNTLDDRARPVDKEVFMRELSFYEIRAAE